MYTLPSFVKVRSLSVLPSKLYCPWRISKMFLVALGLYFSNLLLYSFWLITSSTFLMGLTRAVGSLLTNRKQLFRNIAIKKYSQGKLAQTSVIDNEQ